MPEQLEVKDSNSGVANKTADDILDIFKKSDNSSNEKKNETEKEEEDKELKSDEEENDENKETDTGDIEFVEPTEEDEEKLDLSKSDDDIEIDAPPRKKEILKNYPDLFKKHPFLEKMIYRDREYTQLFGSIDDAKEVAEASETFKTFENQLLDGNTVEILKNVKEIDPKAFDKIVDNYLPNLAKVDRDAYFDVINNVSKQLIIEMVREANESSNDELKQAALIVNQFLFGTSKFTGPKVRVTDKPDEEKNKVDQERLDYVKERFETSRDDLQVKVDNTLRSTISEYIDPKGVMSAYVKKNAINDALKMLQNSLSKDSQLTSNLDRLWKAAFESKFSKDSLDKIKSHYLGRAKLSLKAAILKARSEALKDLTPSSRRKEDEEIEDETPPKRGFVSSGKQSQPKKKEMRRGETVAEFFARDH